MLSSTAIFQFDIFTAVPMDCFFHSDYHSRFITKTILPILVSSVLLSFGMFAKKCLGKPGVLGTCMSIVLAFLFIVYTGIMSDCFGAFLCVEMDPEADGTRYLDFDLRIDCDSDKHKLMQMYARIMILVYPIGVPALIWAILRHHKSVLLDLRATEKKKDAEQMIANLEKETGLKVRRKERQ